MDFSIFCTKIIKIHWKRFCSKFITERALFLNFDTISFSIQLQKNMTTFDELNEME